MKSVRATQSLGDDYGAATGGIMERDALGLH